MYVSAHLVALVKKLMDTNRELSTQQTIIVERHVQPCVLVIVVCLDRPIEWSPVVCRDTIYSLSNISI